MKTFTLTILALLSVGGSLWFTEFSNNSSGYYIEDLYRSTTSLGIINDNYKDYNEVVADTNQVVDEPSDINKHMDKATDDYLGSIEIPVLGMSDAIYKSKGDYYLSHNFKGDYYEPGEIYLDDRTGDSLSDNSALLNGHAVPDGTKFGNFKKLLDEKEQPTILIWDQKNKKTVKYSMLFVSLIDGKNSGIVMKFTDEKQRFSYYTNLHSTSIKKWEEPTEGDTFLLLNSCAYIIDDGHYVVVAKKEE